MPKINIALGTCLDLEAFSDSDWAGYSKTRKSTSGGLSLTLGTLVRFFSRTQSILARMQLGPLCQKCFTLDFGNRFHQCKITCKALWNFQEDKACTTSFLVYAATLQFGNGEDYQGSRHLQSSRFADKICHTCNLVPTLASSWHDF